MNRRAAPVARSGSAGWLAVAVLTLAFPFALAAQSAEAPSATVPETDLPPSVVAAGQTTRVEVTAPTLVRLDGRSNVAAWSCRGSRVDGAFPIALARDEVLAAAADWTQGRPPTTPLTVSQAMVLRIPIDALGCGNRHMERDLHHAVDAEHHPEIFVRLLGLGQDWRREGEATIVTLSALVSLAGTERSLEVALRATPLATDRFRIQVELPLRMTWFGVRPPTGLFGLIRAEDSLRVSLDITVTVAPDRAD